MNKHDALRLRNGDRISYGNSMWTAKTSGVWEGTVLFVTKGGGVRIRPDKGALVWVPYHYVIRQIGQSRHTTAD